MLTAELRADWWVLCREVSDEQDWNFPGNWVPSQLPVSLCTGTEVIPSSAPVLEFWPVPARGQLPAPGSEPSRKGENGVRIEQALLIATISLSLG